MTISERTVEDLARLARLALSPETRLQLLTDLNKMMDLVAQVQAADTQAVEPLPHPFQNALVWRADEPKKPSPEPERLQQLAPEFAEHLYWVPQVIE